MSTTKRHICYVTGTRADFGLMQSTLQVIHRHEALRLSVVVTGMHLSDKYGATVNEILAANLMIADEVPVDLSSATGAAMARNIGHMLVRFVDAFERVEPDVVLLLGDRGEMLAGALAAIHLNIPIAHIHGGERSGTVDEPVRHAISKLSHLHFVTSDDARDRLIRMGERPNDVLITGAPGLDGLEDLASISKAQLCFEQELDPSLPIGLFVYHPVLQETWQAGGETRSIVRTLLDEGLQLIALMPNSDAGSDAIRQELARLSGDPRIRVLTHLPRPVFVSWMAQSDVMIGNSSSGIIEAATFGTPVVNIGPRQNLRLRNQNVADVSATPQDVQAAVQRALKNGRFPRKNVYGDGFSGHKIANYLATLPLNRQLVFKANSY